MPLPAGINTKSSGDPILSTDWNTVANEVIRLDNEKLNLNGGIITGELAINSSAEISGSLAVNSNIEANNIDIGNNLRVGGSITVDDEMSVGGDFVTENLYVSNAIRSTVDLQGPVNLIGNSTNTFLVFGTNTSGTPNGDGFRMRYAGSFFGTSQDALVFEKTDGNAVNPDGGIAFVNTGNDGIVQSSLVIRGTGNVGIKENAPSVALHVNGGTQTANLTATSGYLMLGPSSGRHLSLDNNEIQAKATATTVGTLYLNYSGGTVRVGQGSNGNFDVFGTARKNGGGSWAVLSDKRLKNVLGNFNDGLDKLLKINPVKYKYNGKLGMPTDQEFVGIIAQDIEPVFPYMVKTMTGDINSRSKEPADKKIKNVLEFDGSSLTYVFINAFKELTARLEVIEKKLGIEKTPLSKPTNTSTKTEIQSYLDSQGIQYSKKDTKKDLLGKF